MTNFITDNITFAKATSSLISRGQFPQGDLVPVIPPGAGVSDKSVVKSSQIGKIPGRYDFKIKQWFGLTGAWASVGLTPKQIAQAQTYPTRNVGLRAENFPCVDIDVNSEDIRAMVEALSFEVLGTAPVRVREGAPRALLVYKRDGLEAIYKTKLSFRDGNGVDHAVEVLGLGQQYVVAGVHPSGVEYTWREGSDLIGTGANGLTKITADHVRTFFDRLKAIVENNGWEITQTVHLKGSSSTFGTPVIELEPVMDVDIALAALKCIPNTEDVLPLREDLVGVLAAFKSSVGKKSLDKDVIEECRDWAVRDGWADNSYFDSVWKSLTHVKVGPQRLIGLAHRFGFVADAQEDFRDDEPVHETIDAQQQQAQQDAQKLAEVAKRLLYWPEAQTWIVRDTGQLLSHSALNNYYGIGTEIAPAGATGVRTASNRLVNSGLVQHVVGQTYIPGKPQTVTWNFNGKPALYYNRWHEYEMTFPATASDNDVRPWLNHIEYLFENETDRNYLLDFLAHIAQHRGKKIRWAPIIIGSQGVGKDLFLRPLLKALAHNSIQIEPQSLMSKFVDFFETELVIVQEMLRFEKNEAYERIKVALSGSGSDTLLVERKFKMPYEVPNLVNFLFFTNHTDALNLSYDDRRFFVIQSQAKARDGDYYSELADKFYEEQEGWKKVWTWLRSRDISAFNPNFRPMMNADKEAMIEEGQPYPVLWLREEIDDGEYKNRSILTIEEIMHRCATDFTSVPEQVRSYFKYPNNIRNALKFAQWYYRSQPLRLDKRTARPWCRTEELAKGDPEFLRNYYQSEVSKKVAKFA